MILPIVEYGDVFLVGASVANRKKAPSIAEQRSEMCFKYGQVC